VDAKQPGGFRRFLQSRVGRALLPALAIVVVFATYVYVSTLLAIPAIIVFGLAVPIWAGLKRPRYLAITGLVIILIVGPIATAAITQEIRTPIGPSSSAEMSSVNGTGIVLLNAGVSPYTGGTSTNFNWTVMLQPQYAPSGTRGGMLAVSLYISSCPGATGGNSSYCSSGYTLYNLTHNFTSPLTSPTPFSFRYVIGSVGIWDWQMGAVFRNGTTGNLSYVFLVGDPTYNGIEGPVIGTWSDTFAELVPTVYLNGLLFLGLPFYLVLVLYMFFKSREARRKEAQRRAAGPTPTDSAAGTDAPTGGTSPPGPAGSPPPPSASEKTCPNCNAVVYENETTCWKCGASLTAGPATPLPSGK
jgi:hypothetical protein